MADESVVEESKEEISDPSQAEKDPEQDKQVIDSEEKVENGVTEEKDEENPEEPAEEEPIEPEPDFPDKPLDDTSIAECISLLCKTGDGTSHAYVKFDCKERNITNIDILHRYVHLRYIDLSRNNLKEIRALSSLQHLLTLRCDFNSLTSVEMDSPLPYLQSANFNNNRLQTADGINHPLLEHLSLNLNRIRSLENSFNPSILTKLHTLELRGNRLTTTAGLYLPNLRTLFLAANAITKLEGLERLGELTTLHVRDNQIDSLDGFADSMRSLQYVNIRGNNVQDVREVDKLRCLPMLRALILSENPMSEEDDYRLEVLISIRKITRLDKDEYSEEEREEAEQIFEQRRQEELANQAIAQYDVEDSQEVIQSDAEGGDD